MMTDLLEYTIVGGIKIPNRLLSRKEVATILNLDVVTIWRLAKRGEFDTSKIGRSRGYTPESVTKFLIKVTSNIKVEVERISKELALTD